MASKRTKDIDHFIKTPGLDTKREKEIGHHIGYRYDVNLVPDYGRLTPFLRKYMEMMGWDDLLYTHLSVRIPVNGDPSGIAVINYNRKAELAEVIPAFLHFLEALIKVINKLNFGFILEPVTATRYAQR